MPIVCDYTMINDPFEKIDPVTGETVIDPVTGETVKIVGSFEHPYVIGDVANGATLEGRFEQKFSTRALEHATGLLSLMVRRITTTHPQNNNGDQGARVAIHSSVNGEVTIGRLLPASDGRWRHEQFQIPTNVLSDAADGNTLVIGRVDLPGGGPAHQEFEVRDIVVFFKQES